MVSKTMTLQEFEKFRLSLEQQKFNTESLDPLLYGIERDLFRKDQLKRLISVGTKVESKTVQAKVARWKRKFARLEQSQARLEKLRDEMANHQLQVEIPEKKLLRLVSSKINSVRV